MQLNRALQPLFNAQRRRPAQARQVQARAAEPSPAVVKLQLSKHVDFGVGVAVVGSVPALGEWQANRVVPLAWSPEDIWRGELSLPTGTDIEYKYVCTHNQGGNEGEQASEPHLEWQEGDNLTLHLPAGTTTAIVVDSWQAGHTLVDLHSATTPTTAVPQAVEPVKEEVSVAMDAPVVVPVAVPLTVPVVAAKEEEAVTLRATDDARAAPAPAEVVSNIVPRSAPQPEDPWGSSKAPASDVVKSAKASKAAIKAAKAGKAARASPKDAVASTVTTPAVAPASNILPGLLTKVPANRAAAAVTEETADVLQAL